MLSFDDRLLGVRLRLGDLEPRVVCMTYACGCVCPECSERATQPLVAPETPKQPWDVAA